MIPEAALVVLAGAFAGGIVSGLTGFGTGITALPVRLTAISPVLAGPLGGLAGLSGPLPTIWAGLRGWDKDVKRGVFQAFNTAILAFAFISQAATGLVTWELGALVLVALPGTILGAWLGRRIYNRFDDTGFEKAVLGLLMLSGLLLVASAIHSSLGVTS